MNFPPQVIQHKKVKAVRLDCVIRKTEEGYHSLCPHCPWTSGIREVEDVVIKAYYRHLAYIFTRLGGG